MANTGTSSTYDAAHLHAAWARLNNWGWLRIGGGTRLDFLQRLSTNDLRGLAPGSGLPTVLCSATGRVLALLWVYVGTDILSVRTEPDRGGAVARYLSHLVFWNDDIQVADASTETVQWGLYGPQAQQVLAPIVGEAALAALDGLEPYAWVATEIAGVPVSLHRGGALEVPAWTVVATGPGAEAVEASLASLAPRLAPNAQEQLRVEAGIPAWGRELSDQVTPLESGLLPAISFTKGCYTGQEIIARQMNYDKITRHLVGLLLPPDLKLADDALAPPPLVPDAGPPAGVAASLPAAQLTGAVVRGGSGRPGFVSSVIWSPALSRVIALAIVPRDVASPGTTVTVKAGDHELAATVTDLPFI